MYYLAVFVAVKRRNLYITYLLSDSSPASATHWLSEQTHYGGYLAGVPPINLYIAI